MRGIVQKGNSGVVRHWAESNVLGGTYRRAHGRHTSEGAFASYYEGQRKLLDKSLQKAIDNYKKIES